jgi:hypothetical protein
MGSMEYRDMDVEIFDYSKKRSVERFQVRVEHSPAIEQKQSEAVPSRVQKNLRTTLAALEGRQLSASEIQRLGKTVGQMLFPKKLQDAVAENMKVISGEQGLRIRLKLDGFALADLPWEYAYLEQPAPAGFLALNRRISLVRYEVMPQPIPSFIPLGEDSLRLAVLLADPKHSPDYRELHLDAEEERLRDTLSKVTGLMYDPYSGVTVDTLGKALAKRPHILHFAGHGKFEKTEAVDYKSFEGKGYLVLLSDANSIQEFPVEKLVVNLQGCGVRLVVLGACETARRDGQNAWTGIGPALTQIGIPAVIGMQYGIRNANAKTFSEHFYHALAQGESIDWAMTAGRIAIYNKPDPNERDWGVPVLYLRMNETNAVLFPRLAHEKGSAPPRRDIGMNSYVARTFPCSNPSCNAIVQSGSKYCEQCGQQLKYCTQCKSVVSTNANFCGWCRTPIAPA